MKRIFRRRNPRSHKGFPDLKTYCNYLTNLTDRVVNNRCGLKRSRSLLRRLVVAFLCDPISSRQFATLVTLFSVAVLLGTAPPVTKAQTKPDKDYLVYVF